MRFVGEPVLEPLSHTAAVLVEAGYDVVLLDNLSNSRRDVVERLRQITGRARSDPSGQRTARARLYSRHPLRRPGRRRQLLCRSGEGGGGAGMARHPHRGDVREHVAVV